MKENNEVARNEYFEKAIQRWRASNYPKVIKYCELALKCDPGFQRALSLEGSAHFSLGEYDEALECWEDCIIPVTDTNLWFHKGRAYYEVGNYAKAQLCFSQVLAVEPRHKNESAVKNKNEMVACLAVQGKNFFELKQYDKALECCGAGLAAEKNYVPLLQIRKEVYLVLAAQDAQKIAELESQKRDKSPSVSVAQAMQTFGVLAGIPTESEDSGSGESATKKATPSHLGGR